ncbi:MAG: M20/M25/M40 family metallo-hydrolase [Acidobacteriota bacterium]|nr:M20/M25/M40 family metallo-hydrolase [Acidobacteriota bacterium]
MTVEPPPAATLIIRTAAHAETFTVGEQYYPLSIIDRTRGEPAPVADRVAVVFAGYGMAAPALGYDDFKDVDVRGKAVVVFTHVPQEADARSVFDGTSLTPGAAVAIKAREAMARGAAMLIVADDPSHHVDYAFSRSWWNDPQSDEMGIPVLRVARARLARALPDVDFEGLARTIDITLGPQSRDLAGATISYTEHRARLRPRLRNVVALVRGSDPERALDAIVVGAHYDHLGLGGRFSDSPESAGMVHNGADDNASGVAAILEVCRALARQRPLPRTVVCAAFAGEEIGLLGSDHYVSHPAVQIDRTIAMINLDMVGRARGRVMVGMFGGRRPWMTGLPREMRDWTRLTIDDFARGGYQAGSSDDASFTSQGVPAVAFFTGFHSDYHRPSDDVQRIDAEGGAHIAALAVRLVSMLAAQP